MTPPTPVCPACRRRLYAALWTVGRHRGCRTPAPLDADAFARMARSVAELLGTQTPDIPAQPKESTSR